MSLVWCSVFLQRDSMEVRQPVPELKDVPPPPLHSTGPHAQTVSLSVSLCSSCAARVQLQQRAGLPLYLCAPHPSAAQTPAGCGTHCCAHTCALHSFLLGDPSSPLHLCSHSLHAHCLQDRWRKVGGSHRCRVFLGARFVPQTPPGLTGACVHPAVESDPRLFCFQSVHVDSEKVWPNIPPPVPVCNGCGVRGASPDGLLGVRLGRTAQKYGPYLCCC